MKTIFIFDDSRPTDDEHCVVALGEDGRRFGTRVFDGWTFPHCRYAMGAMHVSEAKHDAAVAVNSTRSTMLGKFDAAYGPGGWVAVWLETPKHDALWLEAVQLARERDARIERVAMSYSGPAFARILAAVFGSADAQPHTTH
ncbi:hypothetical protein [Caballeronia sordidicola]|uniref:Uncharacterized protein n=1 Tax=Caballeronia sordidicola TaxID=196367 RepID=A0A242N754_CABSO|nr:hypothetical protein [Caballeronia sordidicola]OTP79448.1 hypothetical protein PAMC26577_00875 [Caballeronia sordidicola]